MVLARIGLGLSEPERAEDEGVIRCFPRQHWDMAAGGDKGGQHIEGGVLSTLRLD
jgi:hypothetical protein